MQLHVTKQKTAHPNRRTPGGAQVGSRGGELACTRTTLQRQDSASLAPICSPVCGAAEGWGGRWSKQAIAAITSTVFTSSPAGAVTQNPSRLLAWWASEFLLRLCAVIYHTLSFMSRRDSGPCRSKPKRQRLACRRRIGSVSCEAVQL